MDYVNVLKAVSLLVSILGQSAQVVSQFQEVIDRARSEGRDITDEELEELRAKSEDALGRWLELEEES